jgi:hypothetical protein
MAKNPVRDHLIEWITGGLKKDDVAGAVAIAIEAAAEPTGDELGDVVDSGDVLPVIETLPTEETDPGLVLRPTGDGAVEFVEPATPSGVAVPRLNNSGGDLPKGAVVVVDDTLDDAVTTTTTAADTRIVGVLAEDIADGDIGPVIFNGPAELVITIDPVARGQYLQTSTTPGVAEAVDDRGEGTFAVATTRPGVPDFTSDAAVTESVGSVAALALNMPPAIPAGRVLLMALWRDPSVTSNPTVTGWTRIGATSGFWYYYKVAAGADTVTPTWVGAVPAVAVVVLLPETVNAADIVEAQAFDSTTAAGALAGMAAAAKYAIAGVQDDPVTPDGWTLLGQGDAAGSGGSADRNIGATITVGHAGAGNADPNSPANLNDGNGATYSDVTSGGAGGATPEWWWISDLGAIYAVSAFTIKFLLFANGIETKLHNGTGAGSQWIRFQYAAAIGGPWTDLVTTQTADDGMTPETTSWSFPTVSARYFRFYMAGKNGSNIWDGIRIYTWTITGAAILEALGTLVGKYIGTVAATSSPFTGPDAQSDAIIALNLTEASYPAALLYGPDLGASDPGVTDHGALTGLLDDDHTQYRLESEDHSHASSGAQGGQISHANLTGVTANQHHNRDHAATHGPAAADPLKLDDLAAPDDNTDLNATTAAHGLLPKVAGADGYVPTKAGAGVVWAAPSGGGGGSALTVEEVDGSPTDAAITKIVVPNDSLGIAGHVATLRQVPYGFIGCSVHNTAQQSIPNGVGTAWTFNAEEYDTDGFHSTVTATSRLTVPPGLGGKYLIEASTYFDVTPSGNRIVWLAKNGSDIRGSYSRFLTTNQTGQSISAVVDLAAGDYIEVMCYQDAAGGAAQNIGHASSLPAGTRATMTKLDAGRVGSGIGAKAHNVGFQTIPTSVETVITLGAETFDTDGFHSTSSNTSRMTIPAGLGGKYLVTVGGLFQPHASGRRYFQIKVNGVAARGTQYEFVPAAGAYPGGLQSAVLDLVAGDYVELSVFQSSGGNLDFGWDGSVITAQGTLSIMRLDSGGPDRVTPPSFVKRTAGDIALTNDAAWHDIGTIADLSIAAIAGDVLEITLDGLTDNSCRFEAKMVTSGAFAGPGEAASQGIAGWANRSGAAARVGGSIMYTVAAGDIAAGVVAIRLRYTTNASGATKVFATVAVGPLFFAVKNLRQ